MNDQIIRLESLRRQTQTSNYFAGSLYDYLNLGRPNEQQRRQALADIAEYEKQAAESLKQLGEALATLRADAPQVVEEWVGCHMDVCNRIIAEAIAEGEANPDQAPGSYPAVRLYVATETLVEWEKVLKGDLDFVLINGSYLSDYDERVTVAVEESKP